MLSRYAKQVEPKRLPRAPTNQLLTIRDVAARLKVSRRTVYRLVDRGLPVLRVGCVLRFNWPTVLAWIERETDDGR